VVNGLTCLRAYSEQQRPRSVEVPLVSSAGVRGWEENDKVHPEGVRRSPTEGEDWAATS
jgi:hypothetical protein